MNIMKRRILLFAVKALCIHPANGQEEKKWSLQTGFGEINMQENKYDEGDHFVSEDQGNAFYYTHGYRQKPIDIIGTGKACGQMNYLQMKTIPQRDTQASVVRIAEIVVDVHIHQPEVIAGIQHQPLVLVGNSQRDAEVNRMAEVSLVFNQS